MIVTYIRIYCQRPTYKSQAFYFMTIYICFNVSFRTSNDKRHAVYVRNGEAKTTLSGLMFIQSCFIPFSINYIKMIRSWVDVCFLWEFDKGIGNCVSPFPKSQTCKNGTDPFQTLSYIQINFSSLFCVCARLCARIKEPISIKEEHCFVQCTSSFCSDFSCTKSVFDPFHSYSVSFVVSKWLRDNAYVRVCAWLFFCYIASINATLTLRCVLIWWLDFDTNTHLSELKRERVNSCEFLLH